MKWISNYAVIISFYWIFVFILIYLYVEVQSNFKENYEQIENTKMDCEPIYKGLPSAIKYGFWPLDFLYITAELAKQDDICSTLQRFFVFEETALSAEEREFPLAFGFLVQVDAFQVLFTLSLLYQPQNQYCIVIDNRASDEFKSILLKVPHCFSNIRVQIGTESYPYYYKMGVLNNVWQCVSDLTTSASNWRYYQFLAVHDVPLKTNLEMVRILKAINGSINTEMYPYSSWRYGVRQSDEPPLTLYQGEMGVALPRETAEHLVKSRKTDALLNYLEKTHHPYEAFWATVAGSKNRLKAPGTFYGKVLLKLRQEAKQRENSRKHSLANIGKSSIARLEVAKTKQYCEENIHCFFGVQDIPMLLKRPELIAHKVFMTVHPAAYICLAKELRRRSREETNFDASSYNRMPTVELYGGTSIDKLTNLEWMSTEEKREIFW